MRGILDRVVGILEAEIPVDNVDKMKSNLHYDAEYHRPTASTQIVDWV